MRKKVKLKNLRYFVHRKDSAEYPWKELRESLEHHGYAPTRYAPIVVSRNNVAVNGNHRLKILNEISNPDELIEVEVLSNLRYRITFIIGLGIVFPLYLIYLAITYPFKFLGIEVPKPYNLYFSRDVSNKRKQDK